MCIRDRTTAAKQTLNRRGSYFDIDAGIKTIYIKLDSSVNIDALAGSATTDDDSSLVAIPSLWFIITRTSAGAPATVGSVSTIGLSVVNRIEVDSNTANKFLELTVTGKKDNLDQFLLEYDTGATDNNRAIHLTENAATNTASTPFGTIVDYNETITPVIGIAKPSNVTLIEKGNGFNPDVDVVVSKGRQAVSYTHLTLPTKA